MALKGDRTIIETDITQTVASVASRGVVLCYATTGSGAALGDTAGGVDLYASASGKVVAGLLLNDVVNVDETRYHRNFHKLEQLITERSTLLRKGRVVTDQVANVTIVAGDTAYLTSNGQLTNAVSSTGGLVATPKVGKFASKRDQDGFAAVDVNLPIV